MRVSSNSAMTDAQNAIFGAELKRLRKQEKLSATAFGELVGVNAAHIYALETGKRKPSPELAERIADVFNIKVEDMLVTHDEKVWETRREYGKTIRERRRSKGLTVNVVAGALGVTTAVYKEYEQGLCSITEQQKFVLDTILGLNEEPKVIEKEIIVEIPAEIPTVICDVIMEHIKDLQVDAEAQKKIWRYFRKVKLDEEERRLFG